MTHEAECLQIEVPMSENTFNGPNYAAPNYPPPAYPPPNYPPGGGSPAQNMRPSLAATTKEGQPPTHFPLAIVSFLMSGIFGGVFALYFAYQVGQRWQAGNPAGATDAARLAKIWGIVGIVVGAFFLLIVLGSAGSSSTY